jgi:hypothetical protein
MNIKKLTLQALIVSLLPLSATAQKKATIDWYGFVAAQSWMNTRESTAAADGFLYLYPNDEKPSLVDGHDENALPHASWFGTMARLGFTLKGPEIFGAASRAKAEIEFSGHQGSGSVLYRHAFIALDWDKSSLTMGQTWHPMNDLFPSTVGIAIGSPFNALNRSPQLRYEYYAGSQKNVKLMGAAIFQAANTSTGQGGKSFKFNRNSMMPMLYAGVDFTLGDVKLGAGVEYQLITPQIDSIGNKVNMGGFTGMLQAQYAKDKFSFKGKALLGQNMSHLGICSGFGLVDHLDRIEYAPLTALSTWAQVQYGGALKAGLMGGYMSNWGAGKDLKTVYAVGGGNIDNMWRIAPNLQYTVGNLNLGVEYELTAVAYGKLKANGTVTDTHNVTNHRVLLSAMYAF